MALTFRFMHQERRYRMISCVGSIPNKKVIVSCTHIQFILTHRRTLIKQNVNCSCRATALYGNAHHYFVMAIARQRKNDTDWFQKHTPMLCIAS